VIYILKDHLGSCGHKLLENNGLWRYEETTPFGQTVMSGYRLNSQQKKFVGKEQDESGLYYYGARYYDPWQCRFVSVDPLWREYPYYTPYQYAGNRPMNYIDLDGLEPAEPPLTLVRNPNIIAFQDATSTRNSPNQPYQDPNYSLSHTSGYDPSRLQLGFSGALKVVAGGGELAAIGAMMAAPTGVSQIAGAALAGHGAGVAYSGLDDLYNAISGESTVSSPTPFEAADRAFGGLR